MVDYKPQFKPMYFGRAGEKSLLDRISDSIYDAFRGRSWNDATTWKNLTDDFVTTTKNDFKYVGNHVVEGKIIYSSITVGVLAGILGNYTGAYIADHIGLGPKGIENLSLGLELLLHAAGYATTFISMSKADGKTKEEITTNLVKTTAIALPISIGPYPLVRNPLAGVYMSDNISPESATVFSQLTLLAPYAVSVKYSVKRWGSKVEKYVRPIVDRYYAKRAQKKLLKKIEKANK